MPPRKPEGVIPDLIEDLKDFDDLAPRNDGDAVVWDAARKMWVPGAVASGGGGGGAGPIVALIAATTSTGDELFATRDGDTFEKLSNPWSNHTWQADTQGIAHHAGLWVMGNTDNNSGTPYAIATSPDGIDWTFRPSPLGALADASDLGLVAAVCWDDTNSQWVAVGWGGAATSGAPMVLTSPDGITWTERGSADVAAWIASPTTVDAHNGVIIVGSNYPEGGPSDGNGDYHTLVRSTDGGDTFAFSALPGDPGNAPENSMSSSYYVKFVHDRWFFTTDNSVGPGIWASTDEGLTWEEATVAGTALGYRDIAYGAGKFLASAAQSFATNGLLESADGVTWTDVTDRLAMFGINHFDHLAWIGDRFLGIFGTDVYVSADGVTWKRRLATGLTSARYIAAAA